MTDTQDALAAGALTARVYPPVLGIDPGSMHTGLCLRVGVDALEAATVDNLDDPTNHLAMVRYARRVLEVAHDLLRRNRDRLTEIAAAYGLDDPPGVRIGVETLLPPSGKWVRGHQEAISPSILQDLPGAGVVLGVVSEHWRRSIPIGPLGEAHLPDGTYVKGWDAVGQIKEHSPAALRSRTPKGWLLPQPGTQAREHQRSAWAVAGAAHSSTARPLRDQAASAASWAAAHSPNTDAEALLVLLRRAVRQTASYDLLDRLPSLARTVIGATHSASAAERAAIEVSALLEAENREGRA